MSSLDEIFDDCFHAHDNVYVFERKKAKAQIKAWALEILNSCETNYDDSFYAIDIREARKKFEES